MFAWTMAGGNFEQTSTLAKDLEQDFRMDEGGPAMEFRRIERSTTQQARGIGVVNPSKRDDADHQVIEPRNEAALPGVVARHAIAENEVGLIRGTKKSHDFLGGALIIPWDEINPFTFRQRIGLANGRSEAEIHGVLVIAKVGNGLLQAFDSFGGVVATSIVDHEDIEVLGYSSGGFDRFLDDGFNSLAIVVSGNADRQFGR